MGRNEIEKIIVEFLEKESKEVIDDKVTRKKRPGKLSHLFNKKIEFPEFKVDMDEITEKMVLSCRKGNKLFRAIAKNFKTK